MQPNRWQVIEELFHEALDQPAQERTAFLRRRTSDPGIEADVAQLLAAHGAEHRLLDAPAPSRLPEGTHLGTYELERVLGAGGMGTVYLARRADRQFEKKVAIKLVNQGMAGALTSSRFDRERQILARLEHEGIARLLDAGVSRHGQPYLVMEWVDGIGLDAWVESARPSLDQCLNLWLSVAEAVSYAHRNLVVHRDLKPANILVTAAGEPKLVDFGISKLLDDQTGATRTQQFTPRYASPEQIRAEPATTATDIYSLGLILYELAARIHPFHNEADLIAAALHKQPAVPAGLPRDLCEILAMALRKEPERRYATVDQFAADVRRYQQHLPVMARPETVGYRAGRFISRHRVAVARRRRP